MWLKCRNVSVRPIENAYVSGSVLYVCEYDKDKKSAAQDMVVKLKSNRRLDLADFMARELAAAVSAGFDFDRLKNGFTVVGVPRSKRGIAENGFDQAELVGKRLADYLGLRYEKLLGNSSDKKQKKLLFAERKINAESSYYLLDGSGTSLEGRKILLYDDVVTTGATMMSCVKLLRDAGCSEVYCICFASTVKREKH